MDTQEAGGKPTVYWRPGCVFCSMLRRKLRHLGVDTVEVDIWADPAGAAAVRAVTGGDETVPTVVLGDIALVNPSARQVAALVAEAHGSPPVSP